MKAMDSRMDSHDLASALSSNRTEELGFDVWNRFVIPPKLNISEWGKTRKPRVIVGGRGCGKTMLLRYLSHESAFSPERPTFDHSTLEHIGIYWRADTQFASLLEGRGQPDDLWRAAFGHLSVLVLGKEVLSALESIAKSQLQLITTNDLERLDFSCLSTSQFKMPKTLSQLSTFLDCALFEFEHWANDVDTVSRPRFLPATAFLGRLIDTVVQQLEKLHGVVFFAYIDEYENLTVLQQQVVNTWLKHSEPPLIFNLAMKRNGFKTRQTLSEERLVETHDYRPVDLEDFERDSEFSLFAAEILLLRFHNAQVALEAFNPDLLRDPKAVPSRRTTPYSQQVFALARQLLPTWSKESLVEEVFSDQTLFRRLELRITEGLKRRSETTIKPAHFLRLQHPTPAAVVVPALLARRRLSTKQIADEFDKHCAGQPNGFQQGTEWLHNIFLASYLDLFASLVRACPIYSGFDTYCHMAKGNVRHFLELCHKAFATSHPLPQQGLSAKQQAEAASQVAASLLPEVRSFGRLGNDLHSFLLRLGRLFALSQRKTSQSEPERTHFAISDGEDSIGGNGKILLAEAVKWSVLFEERETKAKSVGTPQVVDYVLNPIYAPYFQISYRKGRKLELTSSDFEILSSGSADEFRHTLYARLRQDWDVDQEHPTESLLLWPSNPEQDSF